jgi:hypothetical protein
MYFKKPRNIPGLFVFSAPGSGRMVGIPGLALFTARKVTIGYYYSFDVKICEGNELIKSRKHFRHNLY